MLLSLLLLLLLFFVVNIVAKLQYGYKRNLIGHFMVIKVWSSKAKV